METFIQLLIVTIVFIGILKAATEKAAKVVWRAKYGQDPPAFGTMDLEDIWDKARALDMSPTVGEKDEKCTKSSQTNTRS